MNRILLVLCVLSISEQEWRHHRTIPSFSPCQEQAKYNLGKTPCLRGGKEQVKLQAYGN